MSKPIYTITYNESLHGKTLEDAINYLNKERSKIRKDLLTEGVILFRGFPLVEATDFEKLATALDPDIANYHGQTDRARITGKVYESAPTPGMFDMKLHSETAYANFFPSRGYFYCVKPAEEGGETVFSDNRSMLKKLPSDILEKFKTRKVHYIRNIPPSSNRRVKILKAINSGIVKGWQEMFGTEDKKTVEQFCSNNHLPFKWMKDEWLSLSATLPATRFHRETNEEVWFNQAHVVYVSKKTQGFIIDFLNKILNMGLDQSLFGCKFGDGSEMSEEELLKIREIQKSDIQSVQWQKGDVAMFDNLLVAHGRNPFKGTRKLLAIFSGYQSGTL